MRMTSKPQAIDSQTDTIDRVLYNVESRMVQHSSVFETSISNAPVRRGANTNPTMTMHGYGHGKLTADEIEHLILLSAATLSARECFSGMNGNGNAGNSSGCVDASATNENDFSWSNVDIDSITQLSGYLEEHVKSAMSINLIQEARVAFDANETMWFDSNMRKNSPGMQHFIILRQGIQAATILLSIMITQGIDRRVVNEDAIESIISLMRNHLGKNVIPALSSIGHTASYSPNTSTNTKNTSRMDKSDCNTGQPPRKKQKTKKATTETEPVVAMGKNKVNKSTQQALIKFLKKIYKTITSTVGLLTNLIERLDLLVQSVAIEDQPLLSICSSVMSSLTIDPASTVGSQENISLTHAVQMTCVSLVTTIFRKNPMHRIVILEDLFPLLLQIPTSKRSIRTFAVRVSGVNIVKSKKGNDAKRGVVTPHSGGNGDGQAFIQVITSMILHMIQACVTMPHSLPSKNANGSSNEKRKGSQLSSGLLECERNCVVVATLLLQRCSKKGDEGGASEFRPVLCNLVEDLLLVQMLPEFPAAEMLLVQICRKLCCDLIGNSAVGGGKKLVSSEATYLTTAMDTIGTICSDISTKMAWAKESPLIFPEAVDMDNVNKDADPSSDSKEINRCFCGRTTLTDTFMLDCDRCHCWFHGSCVAIAKDNLPDIWVCDECTMQLMVLDQMKIFSAKYGREGSTVDQSIGDLSTGDKVHIMRVLLLNFLSHQEALTLSSFSSLSRQFHLAKFLKDVDRSNGSNDGLLSAKANIICAHFLDLWNCKSDGNGIIPGASYQNQQFEYLSEEGNSKLMLTLNSAKSQLVSSFPQLLGVIIALMGDENIVSLRKLAVKALSQIVQVDASLMSQRRIREAVAKRFNDEAISVREAAVSLVGIFVLQTPELAKSFHSPLLSRLDDSGISVRKRVIKIFRDLVSGNPSYPGRASVFTKLLSQASDRKEDDGVRDLIHETFRILWFPEYKSCSTKSSNFAVVTPLRDIRCSTNAGDTAKQMLEVVTMSPSSRHLINLVQEMISQGNTDGKNASLLQYCASIVANLIEELVIFEEQRDNLTADQAGLQLVSLLSTLDVFAEAYPSLLRNHYDTILHYLKADNGVPIKCESMIVSHMCKILSHVSSSLDESDLQRLGRGDLPRDVVKITYRFGMGPTGAAVECLAKLATHPRSSKNNPLAKALVKLAKTFYTHLVKMKDVTDDFSKMKTDKERSNVHRALSVLGHVCRFHDDESPLMLNGEIAGFLAVSPSELTWENLPTSSFVLFQKYLEKLDTNTKCKALRAMSGIFSAHPRVMLAFEQEGVLQEIMSDNAHPALQLESLQCWREILVTEEKRVESGEAKRQMESNTSISTSEKISGDQDGDASLIGSVCIQHSPRLFQMTASMDTKVRLHAILLLETLRRQGLLNPMELVPVLFGLLGDLNQPQSRATALKMLVEETEKRPNMIRQLLSEGIKHCYRFQKQIYKDAVAITAIVTHKNPHEKDQIECIFGQTFKDSIRTSRAHSIRVIKSLLNNFVGKNLILSLEERVPMLSFMSEVIAYLPYNHLGDVLFIVHRINAIASLEGNEIFAKMNTFLRPFGLSNDNADLAEVDQLEKVSLTSNPSEAKGIEKIDISEFYELCSEASAIVLLLRLSVFLCEAYTGVTSTRLRSFLPGEKERITDRGVCRINNIPPFKKITINKGMNSLIHLYREFKKEMRFFDASQQSSSDDDRELGSE